MPRVCTAIAADPQLANVRRNLGALLYNRGDLAGAARSFTVALQIDPSHEITKARLQRILQEMKDQRGKEAAAIDRD